jgi:orotate phosphoribosyltransferase
MSVNSKCNDHTEEALKILTDSGALLSGHFLLTSGRHSDRYMQCAQVLKYPEHTEKLARWLAADFADDRIDLVIGPAIGGIIVAYETGRQLGVPAIFAERNSSGSMALRRGVCNRSRPTCPCRRRCHYNRGLRQRSHATC